MEIAVLIGCAVIAVGGIFFLIKRSKDRKAEKSAPRSRR